MEERDNTQYYKVGDIAYYEVLTMSVIGQPRIYFKCEVVETLTDSHDGSPMVRIRVLDVVGLQVPLVERPLRKSEKRKKVQNRFQAFERSSKGRIRSDSWGFRHFIPGNPGQGLLYTGTEKVLPGGNPAMDRLPSLLANLDLPASSDGERHGLIEWRRARLSEIRQILDGHGSDEDKLQRMRKALGRKDKGGAAWEAWEPEPRERTTEPPSDHPRDKPYWRIKKAQSEKAAASMD